MDSGFRGPKFADAVAENGVELVGDLNFFLQGARGIRHWGLTLPPPSTQLWVCLNGQIHLYTLVGIGPSKILLVSGLVRGIVASPFHDSSRRMYIYNKH